MSGTPILSASGLSAGYGDRDAVAELSFTLERGEILCLVGESGCGKSTVLRALVSAPEVTLTAGEILLEGTTLSALPPKERRRLCSERIGLVFQRPGGAFNPIRSYRKQFIEALKSHGKYDAAAFPRRVEEVFARLELKDGKRVLDSCPYALSGGMNQRVSLALSLLLEQDILLCDEPTSALDATIQLQVARELRRLREECGVSQIIVTHNLALARFLADRIGVMYAGRLVESGGAEEVLLHPRHPYTRSLMAAVPRLDGELPFGLPGQPPVTGPAETGCEFLDRCPLGKSACAGKAYRLELVETGHFASCREEEDGA